MQQSTYAGPQAPDLEFDLLGLQLWKDMCLPQPSSRITRMHLFGIQNSKR